MTTAKDFQIAPDSLAGKTILVTGAGDGIGRSGEYRGMDCLGRRGCGTG